MARRIFARPTPLAAMSLVFVDLQAKVLGLFFSPHSVHVRGFRVCHSGLLQYQCCSLFIYYIELYWYRFLIY
jgi:hypothetical protein